jgi:hypothetical protein
MVRDWVASCVPVRVAVTADVNPPPSLPPRPLARKPNWQPESVLKIRSSNANENAVLSSTVVGEDMSLAIALPKICRPKPPSRQGSSVLRDQRPMPLARRPNWQPPKPVTHQEIFLPPRPDSFSLKHDAPVPCMFRLHWSRALMPSAGYRLFLPTRGDADYDSSLALADDASNGLTQARQGAPGQPRMGKGLQSGQHRSLSAHFHRRPSIHNPHLW